MAKDKQVYEENTTFNQMATSLVEKYPEKFHGIEADKICCTNITNKDKPKKDEGMTVGDLKEPCWKIIAVKMPISLHSPYNYYVVLLFFFLIFGSICPCKLSFNRCCSSIDFCVFNSITITFYNLLICLSM